MAKLLVKWETNPNTGHFTRFDVVSVRDDSVPWGNLEGYPTFLRVYLPGISVEQAKFLTEAELGGPLDLDTGVGTVKVNKRAWRVVESRINPPIYAQLEAAYLVSGEYEVSNPDGMLAWLEKKIDGSGRGSW